MAGIPAGGRTYVVTNAGVTISTAITVIQVKAGASNPLWLLRAYIGQENSIVSVQERIRIVRKTVAATVTSSTPLLYDTDDTAAKAVGGTAATGITGTAEGTDGDLLVGRCFDVRMGMEWIATPLEMIYVPAGGIIALKFPVAPASQLWTAQMVFLEI